MRVLTNRQRKIIIKLGFAYLCHTVMFQEEICMGVDFSYIVITSKKSNPLPAGGRSRVAQAMEDSFGDFPITLSAQHIGAIQLMYVASEEEFYRNLLDALKALRENESLVISANY